jgi:hypothetical protein
VLRFEAFFAAAPSLRANGSRERAPDDRLREAIQCRKEDWIASSQELLAMTATRRVTVNDPRMRKICRDVYQFKTTSRIARSR